MAPERDAVRKKILKEPHLGVDEFHWPLKWGRRGYGVVALGKGLCLVEVVDSCDIKTLKGVLPGYEGIVKQDSYSAWLHVWSARQMCVENQERLAQKDLVLNPGGDVAKFSVKACLPCTKRSTVPGASRILIQGQCLLTA